MKAFDAKGVSLRILNLGADTDAPAGKLVLNVPGGVAQFEQEMMLDRQREWIANAMEAECYKGAQAHCTCSGH